MKSSTKVGILLILGSVFMLAGVFAKPLGIPSGVDIILPLISVVFTCLALRENKKAKAARKIPSQPASARRKQFVILAISCGAACLIAPFLMPMTGLVLPFGEMMIISVVSFSLCLGALWLGNRMRT